MSCGQLACRKPCLCAFVDWTVHVDGGSFFEGMTILQASGGKQHG